MLLHECIELKYTDLNITPFHLIYTFNVTKITFLFYNIGSYPPNHHLRILRAIHHYVMYIISR